MTDIAALRQAIVESLPAETSHSGQAPDLKHLYIPPAHIKALRLDCHLVIGTRGAGKSVWTAALGSSVLRKALGAVVPALDQAEVRIGFAEVGNVELYPDDATFIQLLAGGATAYDVWRSVVARWVAQLQAQPIPQTDWSTTVTWVRANPEALARMMQQTSQQFVESGRQGLIVFDALDRLSQNWQEMDLIVRDLLRVALWLKSYPRLSAKVFLREDQAERTVTDFPDASKLLATQAELAWAPHDLHSLLWQTLLNGPGEQGEKLRGVYQQTTKMLAQQTDGRWLLAESCKKDTPLQRALFEALAGPWMGRDKRRGVPYVWAVSHLADGKGRTSPRSFLAAIRQAAEVSDERYSTHPLALHYEGIKQGIQKASGIRVNEMAEDYSWVRTFMEPLTGLNVPCEYSSLLDRWNSQLGSSPATVNIHGLPPQHTQRGWDGIKDDLRRLGVLDLKKDGRIDMPDLYRVGFGLGRKGGVKPKS